MNSNESSRSISSDDIIAFLKNGFMPADNIPEDMVLRNAICMEARASLLIEANCTSERFPAFMKSGRHEDSQSFFQKPLL